MTIFPVDQIGLATRITKESPKKIALLKEKVTPASAPAKDTITISSAARSMLEKMSGQNTTTHLAENFSPYQLAELNEAGIGQSLSATAKSSTRTSVPRQRDFEAYLAGRTFQEVFAEAIPSSVQGKHIDYTF